MSYKVLGLDPYSKHMSLPVLRAIHKLVKDGATVAGPKPTDDPSQADDQAEFDRINSELFGDGTGVHTVGKGKVYAGQSLGDVFNALKVAPDFDYTKPESDARLLFVHRKLQDGDLYFVDNRSDRDETVDASFRVTGKAPELWYAETGNVKAGLLQDRRRAHHRAAAPRAVGHCLRGVPQSDQRNLADAAQGDRIKGCRCRWAVEGELRARSRSAAVDHAGQAHLVERQHRCGREVLFGSRHVHEDSSGIGRLVQEGFATVDRSRRRQEPCRGHREREKPRRRVAHAVSGRCDLRAEARRERSLRSK